MRLAAADAFAAAGDPPALVEVMAGADAPGDALGVGAWRCAAVRWADLRRCRDWRLAALPRRAMDPL